MEEPDIGICHWKKEINGRERKILYAKGDYEKCPFGLEHAIVIGCKVKIPEGTIVNHLLEAMFGVKSREIHKLPLGLIYWNDQTDLSNFRMKLWDISRFGEHPITENRSRVISLRLEQPEKGVDGRLIMHFPFPALPKKVEHYVLFGKENQEYINKVLALAVDVIEDDLSYRDGESWKGPEVRA